MCQYGLTNILFDMLFLPVNMFSWKFVRHVPMKKKLVRGNEVPYMTKALRNTIMKRSELESKYLKNKSYQNMKIYEKQKSFCSKLYKKERKKNLILKLIHLK